LKIIDKACYPPKTEQSLPTTGPKLCGVQPKAFWDEQKAKVIANADETWSLTDPMVAFGLMISNRFNPLKTHKELKICYGERSNSMLLVEYGFAIKNNKYDFVRVKNITIQTFFPELDLTPMSPDLRLRFES